MSKKKEYKEYLASIKDTSNDFIEIQNQRTFLNEQKEQLKIIEHDLKYIIPKIKISFPNCPVSFKEIYLEGKSLVNDMTKELKKLENQIHNDTTYCDNYYKRINEYTKEWKSIFKNGIILYPI